MSTYWTVCIVLAFLMYAYIVRTDEQYHPQHWYERMLDICLLVVVVPAIVMMFVLVSVLLAMVRLYKVAHRRFASLM